VTFEGILKIRKNARENANFQKTIFATLKKSKLYYDRYETSKTFFYGLWHVENNPNKQCSKF